MALPPKSREGRQLQRAISGGMNSGNVFGPVMGFMGLPWVSRGARNPGGSYGPPSWVMAEDFYGNGISRAYNNRQPKPPIEDPPLPPYDPNDPDGDGSGGGDAGKQYWKFPQYSQTWAFTPPEPTPYSYPQPFDPKKYGNPFASGKK